MGPESVPVLLGGLVGLGLLDLLRYVRRERWEYLTRKPAPADREALLTRLGADGWELVDADGGVFFFKRRRRAVG